MSHIKKIFPVVLLTFVNVIGFSLLIPVLPEIIAQYYSGSYSGIIYGALLSTYAAMQFISAPILGSASDRFGRKNILFISQAGTLCSWVIFGAAYFIPNDATIGSASIPLLIIALSRFIDGITGGNSSVAQSWLTDTTTVEERTKSFGVLGATFGVGFAVGPALGGLSISTQYNFLGTAAIATCISIAALVFIGIKLKESLPKEKRKKELEVNLQEELNFFAQLSVFDDTPNVKALVPIRLVLSVIFSGFTTILTLLMKEQFGLSSLWLGVTLSLIGVFAVFHNTVSVSFFTSRYGDRKTFLIGVFVIIGALICFTPVIFFIQYSWIAAYIVFLLLNFCTNFGMSVANTTFRSYISQKVDEQQVGQATGVHESMRSFGEAVSPISGTWLYGMLQSWIFIVLSLSLCIPMGVQWFRSALQKQQT